MEIQWQDRLETVVSDQYIFIKSGNVTILVLVKDEGLVVENFTDNPGEFRMHQDSHRFLFTGSKEPELYKYRV